MRLKILYYIIPLAILLVSSCETEMHVKEGLRDPKIVVNGFVSPDSLIKVRLTESRFFLDNGNDFKICDDADVFLSINGSRIEKLQYKGNGNYLSSVYPMVGDEIQLEVESDRYNNVLASTYIPAIVPIKDLSSEISDIYAYSCILSEIKYIHYSDDDNYMVGYNLLGGGNIKISFSDPAEENYYLINCFVRYYYEGGAYIDNYARIHSSDQVYLKDTNRDEETYAASYNEFNDKLFNGKDYSLYFDLDFYHIVVYDKYWEMVHDPEGNFYRQNYVKESYLSSELIIELRSISKDLYNYASTITYKSITDDFFSEPVQIYNNVKGGYGIVAGYSSSEWRIPFVTNTP